MHEIKAPDLESGIKGKNNEGRLKRETTEERETSRLTCCYFQTGKLTARYIGSSGIMQKTRPNKRVVIAAVGD